MKKVRIPKDTFYLEMILRFTRTAMAAWLVQKGYCTPVIVGQ